MIFSRDNGASKNVPIYLPHIHLQILFTVEEFDIVKFLEVDFVDGVEGLINIRDFYPLLG